jgi:hypothetical protein
MNLSTAHHAPSANLVVRVSCEERLAVRAPRKAHTLRLAALLTHIHILRLELIDLALLLEIENDDAASGSSAEPVAVWREDEGVDLVAGGEGVEVLGLVEIPEHGGAVLAARGAKGAIRRDGDGVDVAGVTNVVGLDAAGGEFPDLFKHCN